FEIRTGLGGKELWFTGASRSDERRAEVEANNTYNVTVNANDASASNHSAPDASQSFTLTVTDVNEAPTAVSLLNPVTTIAENTDTSSGYKVADITVTDDALGSNTLTLTGSDAGSFEIRTGLGGKELWFTGAS